MELHNAVLVVAVFAFHQGICDKTRSILYSIHCNCTTCQTGQVALSSHNNLCWCLVSSSVWLANNCRGVHTPKHISAATHAHNIQPCLCLQFVWDPRLVFTGTTILGVNPENGKHQINLPWKSTHGERAVVSACHFQHGLLLTHVLAC